MIFIMEPWLVDKLSQYKGEKYRFKSCCVTWIVVLEIVDGLTITNEKRRNVVNQNYAHFRGNVFKVVDIIHKLVKDKTIQTINSSTAIVEWKVNYTIGELVSSNTFDHDIDETYTTGIHYYKTPIAAFHAELEKVKNGRLYTWNHQGTKLSEKVFRNGYEHGMRILWHHNGVKYSQQNYQGGVKIGREIKWNPSGKEYD